MLADPGVHFPDPFPSETSEDKGLDEDDDGWSLAFGDCSPPPPPPPPPSLLLLERLEAPSLDDLSPMHLVDLDASPFLPDPEETATGDSEVDRCLAEEDSFALTSRGSFLSLRDGTGSFVDDDDGELESFPMLLHVCARSASGLFLESNVVESG